MEEEIPLLPAGKAVGSRVSVIKVIGYKGGSVPVPSAFLDIEVKSAGATAGHMRDITQGGHVALKGDGLGVGLEFHPCAGGIGVKGLNALVGLIGHGQGKPPEYRLLPVMVQSVNGKGGFSHISKDHERLLLSLGGEDYFRSKHITKEHKNLDKKKKVLCLA